MFFVLLLSVGCRNTSVEKFSRHRSVQYLLKGIFREHGTRRRQ